MAISEILVLKHLGAKPLGCFSDAFSSLHPSPETRAYEEATPKVLQRPVSRGLEDLFG